MVSDASCKPIINQTLLHDHLNSTLLLAHVEMRKQTERFRNIPLEDSSLTIIASICRVIDVSIY